MAREIVMGWLIACDIVVIATGTAVIGKWLDRRAGAGAGSCISGRPSTALAMWTAFALTLALPPLLLWLLA